MKTLNRKDRFGPGSSLSYVITKIDWLYQQDGVPGRLASFPDIRQTGTHLHLAAQLELAA